MLYPRSRIMIFAKAPEPGNVKTRLIPHYGETYAMELHRAMLWHNLSILSAANLCPLELWCAPDALDPFFVTCRETFKLTLRVQRGASLGDKMENAFTQLLAEAKSALVIGADCPTLQKKDYVMAFDYLSKGMDVVISPAADGGYVLLGMNTPQLTLFENINWGTDNVYRQTIEKIRTAELHYETLATHQDIDLPADVKSLAKNPSNLHPTLKKLLLKA